MDLTVKEVSGFDVEEMVVDLGFWFNSSSNCHGCLTEFAELHREEYMEILLQISVRWLSLERCINRIVKLYQPLASFFKTANLTQARIRRLQEAFSNPMTEVHLLFYQATIPAFSSLNFLLQREQPSIYLLYDEMVNFIRKLCARFMVPAALQSPQEPHSIAFKEKANHLQGGKLNIGFTTRAKLNSLLKEGHITPQHVEEFHTAALAFLIKAVDYTMKILPLENPLLRHAKFADVRQRLECSVDDALYFVDRFSHLLPYTGPHEHDQLTSEFLEYQTMTLPPETEPDGGDMAHFWAEMANHKHKVTGVNSFQRLASIAKLVLVLPHSNADAERVLSAVGLNKTKTRSSLAPVGTLSSIMTVKMAGLEPCWEPPPALIKASKKAASHYNKTTHPPKSSEPDAQPSSSEPDGQPNSSEPDAQPSSSLPS
ncbi:uncharacterized protein LOC134452176 isoform X2 [Engraulis encrasicolus]|uniref:uncharacterized protein LOC134452176 isoform X2 n=1 Tax=Engraulis encrasicolus TaxID=184585 RepID=UPI002FD27A92